MRSIAEILGVPTTQRMLLMSYSGENRYRLIDEPDQAKETSEEYYLRVPSSKPDSRIVVVRRNGVVRPLFSADTNCKHLNQWHFSWWYEEVSVPAGLDLTPIKTVP